MSLVKPGKTTLPVIRESLILDFSQKITSGLGGDLEPDEIARYEARV